MSNSIDYHFVAFDFEQNSIVTNAESKFGRGICQALNVAREIFFHKSNFFDDATRLDLVDCLKVPIARGLSSI